MATSAYASWLKKREFKAPRTSASPPVKLRNGVGAAASKGASEDEGALTQHKHQLDEVSAGKFHVVSSVETTRVAVQSVARPSVVGKRPRSWLSSGEGDAGREKDTKVAGTKRLRTGKDEVIKATALKLVSASKLLRQSSAKRERERTTWSGRVEAKVAAKVALTGVKQTSSKDKKTEKEPTKKRTLRDIESGDKTTKRLRFDDEEENADNVFKLGLPPKSPLQKKKRKVQTAMLDESQYWMAVDRFSHLT